MGFLQKLKSLLGFGRTREPSRGGSRARGRESDVTVERQPSTETEEAVKRSQPGASQGTAGQTQAPSQSQPQGQPQGQSQPQEQSQAETAEPAPGGEAEAGEAATEGDDASEGATETADADAGTDEDVTVIKGIGPAYGDRLEAVGIDTVADLATADADEIATETDLSEKRVSGWIERARDR